MIRIQANARYPLEEQKADPLNTRDAEEQTHFGSSFYHHAPKSESDFRTSTTQWGQHGGVASNFAALQFQGPWFDPDLDSV